MIEPFGGCALCLRETPAALGAVDGRRLLADVADALAEDAAGAGGAARRGAEPDGLPRLGAGGAAAERRRR